MADVLAGPAALADAQVKHVQGTGQSDAFSFHDQAKESYVCAFELNSRSYRAQDVAAF
jgi:hypothetical protein